MEDFRGYQLVKQRSRAILRTYPGCTRESNIVLYTKADILRKDEAKEILKQHDVTFSEQGCVTLADKKIITAQGPDFAEQFAKAILEQLG